ncbi:cytochrome P450 [Daldinia loculata]|nr:cytochrome P450 [Daldinia loculata]
MTRGQLTGNASILISAGSETTAILLTGLTYLLTKNPRVHEKLKNEIRGTFQSPNEITVTRVNQCRYLLACMEAALRVYPPPPQPHQRIVPPEGAIINGEHPRGRGRWYSHLRRFQKSSELATAYRWVALLYASH